MNFFDVSADGFWRSFIAVALTVPLYVLILMMPAVGGADNAMISAQMAVNLAAVLLTWLAVLLGMLGLSRLVNCSGGYPTFVIVYNWSNVVVSGLMLAAAALASLMPGTLAAFLLIVMATGYGYAYTWLVIREGFGIDGVLAFMFLIVLVLVELLVNFGIGGLSGMGAEA